LLDPIKPAYNQSRPDGRLKLTAEPLTNYGSVCRQSWSHNSYNSLHPINFLHYCLPSPDFMVQRKVTEADTLTICLGATQSGLSVSPPPLSPHFYAECPFWRTLPIYPGLAKAPNNAGLHMQWLWYNVYNQLINMLKVYIPVESCYNTYTGHIDMQCGMCRQLRN